MRRYHSGGFVRDRKKKDFYNIQRIKKKNGFIFYNFQYVSSTLNFNIGGYEKARRNYIRSLHTNLSKNRNESERIFLASFFDPLRRPCSRMCVEKGERAGPNDGTVRIGEDGTGRGGGEEEGEKKGQRRLGEKRGSAG